MVKDHHLQLSAIFGYSIQLSNKGDVAHNPVIQKQVGEPLAKVAIEPFLVVLVLTVVY